MEMGSDLRAALRMPLRNPGWAAALILTFAIGIGANTAVFSLVEALVLRPLPFAEPHDLIYVDAVVGSEPGHLSKREYRELIKATQAAEAFAGYYPSQYNIIDPPSALVATIGTSNLFSVLGARMVHGDAWTSTTDFQRAYNVVLTHRIWQQRFGGRADIVGQPVVMDGANYRVTGVLDEGFDYPVRTDVYRSITDYDGDHVRRLWVVGRMRDGRTLADVQGELDRLSEHFERVYPDTNRAVRLRARPLGDLYLGAAKPYLLMLPAAVALLLIIACANVANLLLSRALSRGGELAVRMAIGADARDLARLALLEATVLALPGAVVGILASHWALQVLMAMVRTDLPAWFDVRINALTLLFTLVVAVLTAVVVGIVPALHARRLSLEQTLRQESGRNIGPRGSRTWRAVLIGAQAALATVLLISATVFVLGVWNLQRTNVGFDANGLSTFRTDPPFTRYATIPQISTFYRQAIERLRERPGVVDAASNQRIPFAALDVASPRVSIEGRSASDAEAQPFVNFQVISPGYFDVMRIPLLHGRPFTEFDRADTSLVAIVSDRAARRFWGSDDPIGRRLSLAWNQDGTSRAGGAAILLTVVGVAGNVRSDGLQQEPGLDVYAPYTQTFAGDSFFVVRTTVDPEAIVSEIPRAIAAVDPEQSHFGVMSMRERVAASMWQQQVAGSILAVFAVVAFVLSTVGVHAVTSYSVAMRKAEMGVRLALGAEQSSIVRTMVQQALKPVALGLLAGMIGGALGAAALAERLPVGAVPAGVSAIVPPLLLLLVAAIAAGLPTMRIVGRTDLPSVLR
jgi:putative ABC transport system permease protein